MIVRITKRVFKRMTDGELSNVGRVQSNLHGLDHIDVSLSTMVLEEITNFKTALLRLQAARTRMLQPLIDDIDLWVGILNGDDAGAARPKTMQQFADFATEYLRQSPGHRVYIQEDSSEWVGYYVNSIDYQYETKSRDYWNPASVEIHLMYWLLGNTYHRRFTFGNKDIDGCNTAQAIGSKGMIAETLEKRADYLATKDRFDEVFPRIGYQYTTEGFGESMDRRWGSGQEAMMRDGEPAKVVIDVPRESGDENDNARNAGGHARTSFWGTKKPKPARYKTTEDLGFNESVASWRRSEWEAIQEPPEIPVHPYVVAYHLAHHRRYRIHVNDLKEYRFNKQLGDHLVLPNINKRLIDVLVSQGRISFQDIIEGKGAGACVLLGGPPGVGKTLTAEVFAEATERPLLSVQAAQLGVNPETIETNLRNTLSRASRWNAVVLIDEADVYIAERGSNLTQNSIVAAFLRVLEHHTATIFMTTNRLATVDDAIASRCLARIHYAKPDIGTQKRIWEIMNELNDAGLVEDEINAILAEHNDLSGRDIKQTLKLACLWAGSNDVKVDPETIDFVTKFLPTTPTG